ncbi:uncharacterized protein BCR38DRAFT_422485 [Pseudomassariella vexata]|uniref:Copper acquisition factor BIM1-like domain-containing protein n=1 Tax=Pseudomassariella vexata TaxID=1141098 RepID=A0A1Y2EBK1_9PEZI|nr:uncharacterized protein BCR38DRAFT_422485 [Pseudomassariella vexata]ORY68225.1 hypothetical protein BCR38DRAFT_422485 [Pseudomassariella vexata]
MMFKSLIPACWVALVFLGGAWARPADDEHDEQEADDMGPAAFLWPADREWVSYHDNVAPCGSADGPTNRTDFPLTGGKISLVQQDESYNVQVAISYQSDPESNDDFEVLISGSRLSDLDPGHQCIPVSDPPSGTAAGSNATLQIKYTSEFDTDKNETFYACADITYVLATNFDASVIPCFNVSQPEDDDAATTTTAGAGATATSDANTSGGSSSGSSSGLSGGAIAGIVIGCVVGVGLLGSVLFFLYRRDQREKRLAQHQVSARNVKWDETAAGAGSRASNGESGNSVQLQDMRRES